MNEDEFLSYVEFESEDGEVIELQILDYFEYEGEMYAILADLNNYNPDAEDLDVAVLRVIETDEGQTFVEPDEALYPELQAIVNRLFEEEDECGCDDDECGCGHHHHHDDECDCGHHHHGGDED